MQRLAIARSKQEIVAIVREYVRDWHPSEHEDLPARIFNQTERFIIERARIRLAVLDRDLGSIHVRTLREAMALDIKTDKAISDIWAGPMKSDPPPPN
jgi:hypothetical protein